MSTNYPTSIDNLTKPTSNDYLDTANHVGLHVDIIDAVKAIETKLGTGEKLIAGDGSYTNVNPNTKLIATDSSDARAGAVVNDKGIFLKYSNGANVSLFGYDYYSGSPLPLILNEYGGQVSFGDSTQESWHEIGAAGQPAFQNSWVNFGSGWETAAYMKDSMGFVHFKGLLKGGTVADNNTTGVSFTLPAGYRPAANTILAATCDAGIVKRITIYSSGEVSMGYVSPNYTSLSGITFKAEA